VSEESGARKARMKAEGGNDEKRGGRKIKSLSSLLPPASASCSLSFILYPSAFILALLRE